MHDLVQLHGMCCKRSCVQLRLLRLEHGYMRPTMPSHILVRISTKLCLLPTNKETRESDSAGYRTDTGERKLRQPSETHQLNDAASQQSTPTPTIPQHTSLTHPRRCLPATHARPRSTSSFGPVNTPFLHFLLSSEVRTASNPSRPNALGPFRNHQGPSRHVPPRPLPRSCPQRS